MGGSATMGRSKYSGNYGPRAMAASRSNSQVKNILFLMYFVILWKIIVGRHQQPRREPRPQPRRPLRSLCRVRLRLLRRRRWHEQDQEPPPAAGTPPQRPPQSEHELLRGRQLRIWKPAALQGRIRDIQREGGEDGQWYVQTHTLSFSLNVNNFV